MTNLQVSAICLTLVVAGALASGGRFVPLTGTQGMMLDRYTGEVRMGGRAHFKADVAAMRADMR